MIAVLVGVALRILFLLVAPFGGDTHVGRLSAYNDECAHFNYIVHLLEHRKLPRTATSIQESGVTADATFEHYQPPLYYLVSAPAVGLWRRMDPETSYLAARIVSFAAGILLLPLGFAIVLALGLSRSVAVGALIVTSLLGSFARFTVLVSNDAFSWLFAGLAIYCWLRAENDSLAKRYSLFWCLALIAGLYTKLSLLLLLPLPLVCSLLQGRWRRSLNWFALTILAVIATLPLWLRNVHAFGSLLPISTGFGEAELTGGNVVPTLAYAVRSFFFPWQEFWGGWPGGLLVLGVIVLCGCLIVSSMTEFRKLRYPIQFVLLFLAAIGGFAWLNLHYFQAEGRYLLISWPAWMALLAVGAATVTRHWVLFGALLAPYLLFLVPLGEWVRV